MIFAQYKNDEKDKTFTIHFSNVAISDAGYKPVNATYHLENAINKGFDGEVRPEKFHIKIVDEHNHYLKLIAIAFAAYIRGLGFSYPDLTTENF